MPNSVGQTGIQPGPVWIVECSFGFYLRRHRHLATAAPPRHNGARLRRRRLMKRLGVLSAETPRNSVTYTIVDETYVRPGESGNSFKQGTGKSRFLEVGSLR